MDKKNKYSAATESKSMQGKNVKIDKVTKIHTDNTEEERTIQ